MALLSSKNGSEKKLKQFQTYWLEENLFKDFLCKVKDDSTKFRCKICQKTLTLSTEGRPAIVRHAEGQKHTAAMKRVKNYFAKTKPIEAILVPYDQSNSQTDETEGKQQATLVNLVTTESVLVAEIIWVLQAVKSGYSFNSCDHLPDVFRRMFDDSEKAKKFKLGRTKLGYIVSYGLGPYFKNQMIKSVTASPIYSLSFDESLCEVVQKNEMVVMVRFWDSESNLAKVHYLGSAFMGHSKADDLLKQFGKVTECLDDAKVLQISMDGPNVNHLFYQKLSAERMDKMFHSLINIGTCSLHSINGSVKNGFKKVEYMINMIHCLKGLFVLLHGSAARQDDYHNFTGSTLMPLFFCATRWVENKKVSERLIEIWPYCLKIVKYWKSLCKSKQPKGISFERVSSAVEDEFLVAKLKFFAFICGLVEPYLVKYQTQNPMVPFMYADIKCIVKSLLNLIIKPDVLDKCTTPSAMMALKFDEHNLLKPKDMTFGFGVKEIFNEMRKKDTARDREINQFKIECSNVIKIILTELYVRSPLAIDFVRYAALFDPAVLAAGWNKRRLMKCFKGLLNVLMECKIMSSADCDAASLEFNSFIDDLPKLKSVLESFDKKQDRLDEFYFSKVNVIKYPHTSNILRWIFCLFHGQASAEREFNVNNIVDRTNMDDETIIAQKMIIDYMRFHNLEPKDVVVDKDMVKAVKNSNKEYLAALEKKRHDKVCTDNENRKLALTQDIKDIQKKQTVIEKAMQSMNDEAEECFKRAVKKNDMALVVKGNSLKRSCEESKSELLKLEEIQKDLVEKRKKLC